jgi:hypothetical protein
MMLLLWSIGSSTVRSQDHDRVTIDSTKVESRNFDDTKLEEYRLDPEFQYGEVSTVGMSIWDRLKLLVGLWLAQLFAAGGESDWVRILIYLVCTGVVVYVILKLLKVDIKHIFYRPARQVPIQHRQIDDDIHEMDLDNLIKEALNESRYREAIRLVYLSALKELSGRDHLQWKIGKTNHEYMIELIGTPFQKEFDELSYYFDYSWYGQFSVDQSIYKKVSVHYGSLIQKVGK